MLKEKVKRMLVGALAVVTIASMMPVSVFADNSSAKDTDNVEPEYGTHEYWEKLYPNHSHTDSFVPGEKIGNRTGKDIYFINKNITVEATEEGQSGLVIDGYAELVFEDNCTLTVKGADATSIKGAGAGIELVNDNNLRVKGTGELVVTGGKGMDACSGSPGQDADDDNSGDGGRGGDGGGGAGAAIGTPGSDGGAGGKAVKGRHEGTAWRDYSARNGNNGANSEDLTQDAGGLKVSGNVKLTLNGGEPGKGPQNGEYLLGGKNDYENEGCPFLAPYNFTSFGGGGAGGSGGAGWSGAKIGFGGIGGAGGGSGSSGAIKNYFKDRKAKKDDLAICGGEGGCGDGEIKESDERLTCYYETLGNDVVVASTVRFGVAEGGKGHGDNDSVAGNAGKRGEITKKTKDAYVTTLADSNGDNQEAAVHNVYPADECQMVMKDKVIYVIHIPTGKVLERDKDYSQEIEKQDNGYRVKAFGGKLVDSTMSNSGSLYYDDCQTVSCTVKHFLQDLTSDGEKCADSYTCVCEEPFDGVVGAMTEVKAKNYEGFTAKDISQNLVKEDGKTVVNVYYDRNNYKATFDMGEHSAYAKKPFDISICYGANIQKNLPEGYDLPEQGYLFAGFSPALNLTDVMKDNNLEYKALWVPKGQQARYEIIEYGQKLTLDGQPADTYETIKSYKTVGYVNSMSNVIPFDYPGFTALPIEQKIIKDDGSTVVEVYYNRNMHDITFDMGEHSALAEPVVTVKNVCFGVPIAKFLPEGYDLAEKGYKFAGWSEELTEDTTMPDNDVNFIAQWRAKTPAKYTEKIYVQGLSSDEKQVTDTYSLLREETKDGYVGDKTDVNPEVEGLHAKPYEQKVIQEDGKTVVEVYMDRDAYDLNLTFKYGSAICKKLGTNVITIPVKMYYGASIEKNLPQDYNKSIRGYRFKGFTPGLNPSEKASPETITSKDYVALFTGAF